MKKILLMALAAATMVGCSQNEEIENAAKSKEIKFGTVVNNTTRAAITNDAALQGTGFIVYAYNTGANTAGAVESILDNVFMNALSVTYSGGWSYTGNYYWPLTDNVQFFAYAKDVAATDYLATGLYPTIKYTVAATAAAQKDFVVASALDKTKTDVAVGLPFTHALTQVNFSAKGSAGFTYKITSVGLEGVFGAGTYNFKDATWATDGEVTNYTYPIAAGGADVSGEAVEKLDQTDGALMLIPQAMTAESKIVISYEVYKDLVKIDEVTNTKINLNTTATWESGKKVRYTLTLTANGATVNFAPEVGNWNPSDDQDVPVQ